MSGRRCEQSLRHGGGGRGARGRRDRVGFFMTDEWRNKSFSVITGVISGTATTIDDERSKAHGVTRSARPNTVCAVQYQNQGLSTGLRESPVMSHPAHVSVTPAAAMPQTARHRDHHVTLLPLHSAKLCTCRIFPTLGGGYRQRATSRRAA